MIHYSEGKNKTSILYIPASAAATATESQNTHKKNADSSQLDRFVMAHNILKKPKKDNITTSY